MYSHRELPDQTAGLPAAEADHFEHGQRSLLGALSIRTHQDAEEVHPVVAARGLVGNHLDEDLAAADLAEEIHSHTVLAADQEEAHHILVVEDTDRSRAPAVADQEVDRRSTAEAEEDRKEDVHSHRLGGCRSRDSPGLDTCSNVAGSSDRGGGLGM